MSVAPLALASKTREELCLGISGKDLLVPPSGCWHLDILSGSVTAMSQL